MGPDAPKLDLVVTVCNLAANEPCPAFVGDHLKVHWRFPDPTACKENEAATAAFQAVFNTLKERIERLKQVDRLSEKQALHQFMLNLVDAIPYRPLEN